MGYTAFTKQLVEKYIGQYNPKSVIDLGAQNDFSGPNLPAPYISEWYKGKGIMYACIDLNGENKAIKLDLSFPFYLAEYIDGKTDEAAFVTKDMVLDIGTSEHIERNSKFDIEAYYNCWLNKHNLLKKGGIMINENPMTGSWPGHGYNYLDTNFYFELCKMAEYELLDTGTQAAMGNTTDGWNVWGVIRKTGDQFLSLNQFAELPIKQS